MRGEELDTILNTSAVSKEMSNISLPNNDYFVMIDKKSNKPLCNQMAVTQ